jgi:hypothetical protein
MRLKDSLYRNCGAAGIEKHRAKFAQEGAKVVICDVNEEAATRS